MWAAGGVLLLAYGFIFTDWIERSYAAVAGAVVMVVIGGALGFYSQAQAIQAVDANTMLLLLGMMILIAMIKPTGGFEYLGIRLVRLSGGSPVLLMLYLGVTVSVLSTILDNVTTVIIFAPLTVLVTRLMHLNPAPFLIAEAMLSNIGGAATLVGDPPNILIGSAADISFVTFLVNMVPLVVPAWLLTLGLLLAVFRKELVPSRSEPFHLDLDENQAIRHPQQLKKGLVALGVVVVLFFVHHWLHYYPALVALIGMSLGLLLIRPDPEKLMKEVEWTVLIFFAGLFVMVGGVEASGMLNLVSAWIADMARDPGAMLITSLALMWVSALLSALIGSIPFTITMIPVVHALAGQGIGVYPLWWALAIGVGLGANGTHIGAMANVVCLTEAEKSGMREARITPVRWLKTGVPVVITGLMMASLSYWLMFTLIGFVE
ncbi:MAG: SLC13 family permease [Xanthomonadales bacterium]|nr:SLC13 family permease [Xanthomonadales bacterium]